MAEFLPRRLQRGMTLIELLIAMALALFLVGGVLTLLDKTRRTFTDQNGLSQLQDNQRLAMTLITDVIQSAGYFVNPTGTTLTGALPIALPSFPSAGQSITGTYNAGAADTITVRYQVGTPASGDNTVNCQGQTVPGVNVNLFAINIGTSTLTCDLGTGPVDLVSGITQMRILYGVKTDFTQDNGSADTYLRADQMAAADWGNVISVRVTLTFKNPLAGQPGQTTTPTIDFTRLIGVMARAGVKT